MHRSGDGEHYTNTSKKFDKLWLTNFKRLRSPSSFGFQIINTYKETSFSDVGLGNFLDNQLRWCPLAMQD